MTRPDQQSLPHLTGGEAGQREVIGFLCDPATHGGLPVERVDTHISRIFLAGDRAWKMKRAIRTNYLDFSTLALRGASCRREMEVNAAAGDLYREVIPVTRREGRLHLGGDGTPVEWLVGMRRFDRNDELGRLCDAGRLTRIAAEDLADRIALGHAAAPVTPDHGDDADLRGRIDQIAGALSAAADGRDLARAARDWRAAAHRARQAQAGLIACRHRCHRIRRCHGDLHLGNVVMIAGQPTPFDAIEFNEAIASIDVLYDLALTLADLLARGRGDLGNAMLNRYLSATRDYRGLALMPLFLSMRGAVRAMTAASRGDDTEARRNLDFAIRALSPPAAPRLLAIGGLSGSGKSSIARALAPRMGPLTGAVVIRSDVTRKRLAGAAPETRLPETGYSAAMNRRVMARMTCDARAALRTGTTVLLDATFLGADWQACVERLAMHEGVAFDGLWLDLPPEAAMHRVEARGPDASDATTEVIRRQVADAACPAGWHQVPAGGRLDEVIAAAATALRLPDAYPIRSET
ncbi:AAA family ATPase [Paracoccus marinaquae]|uniref:AAA family ATPase n=1 Tax=Paracoccus marinaquae TaxID=2841926 RepID=A0ABS6AMJ4_9RHOB|nr:AAA family ATPase [Paracoccus marinaquae]MBU3031815.1 AAA family ATPase [Paracoccus marinaquae]